MQMINTMRHVSIFDPAEFNVPIHIIGVGATGSRVFASLVELGCENISVYDYDIVEEHNLANQIYTASDINNPKVKGCEAFYTSKTGLDPDDFPSTMQFVDCKVTPAYMASTSFMQGGVVFIMTDTMDSRKSIANSLLSRVHNERTNAHTPPIFIIETRMASTHGSVLSFNPFDDDQYKAWCRTLVDDSDEDSIEVSPCGTAMSVGTTASLIANYAVWQMIQFFTSPMSLQPRIDMFFKPTLTITSPALAA
jgi:hypothetical protein